MQRSGRGGNKSKKWKGVSCLFCFCFDPSWSKRGWQRFASDFFVFKLSDFIGWKTTENHQVYTHIRNIPKKYLWLHIIIICNSWKVSSNFLPRTLFHSFFTLNYLKNFNHVLPTLTYVWIANFLYVFSWYIF